MLQLLSSLTNLTRIEVKEKDGLSPTILASGTTGTWVTMENTSKGTFITWPTAGDMAFPIWTEANRDGSAGWSPDVTAISGSSTKGAFSVLYGKVWGITDQVDSGNLPTIGAKLYVTSTGKLTTVSTGKAVPVAICTRTAFPHVYLSKSWSNSIEFVTI